jgi:hypothetical protein
MAFVENMAGASGALGLKPLMRPCDIFGVVVRTIGFLIMIASLWQIFIGVDMSIAVPGNPAFSETPLFLMQLLGFVFGLACLLGADAIVRIAYRTGSES